MTNRTLALTGISAILALALPVGAVFPLRAAQEASIQLPPDNPSSTLKPGEGVDTVQRQCVICHSTDYIVRQPHFTADKWEAEVRKMMTVYGARITDADFKVIADYLAKHYGPDNPTSQKLGSPR